MREVERHAPDAWVINFINPTAVLGILMGRYAPNVRSMALCDALHLPYLDLQILKTVGLLPQDAESVPPEIRQKLESRCDADMNGVRPHPVGDMPLGLRGLTQQVLDTHDLTARAAAEFDRDALLQAMLIDPLVHNIADARAIIEESFERQKDALDPRWFE